MIYPLLRQALFTFDPETAHRLTLSTLQRCNRGPLARWLKNRVPALPVEVMGIRFPNPIGLGAGLDKNGDYIRGLSNLGFGFIEIGTITPRAQAGNSLPRLFRLPQRQALINRMGFNNIGVEYLLAQLRRTPFDGVLGINIGKNRDTPVQQANRDYLHCLRAVYPHASYIAINISSPNTPGLRKLQHGDTLETLFGELKSTQESLAKAHRKYVPLAIKIAPDLECVAIDAIADAVCRHHIDAVIATNTSDGRSGVQGLPLAAESGGLSGAPLRQQATEVVRRLAVHLRGHVPIIAAGGVLCGADAQAKIDAGAQLVQLYSGLIYRGPGLIRDCVDALSRSR